MRPMRKQKEALTVEAARTQLAMMLVNATDSAVAGFTVSTLCRMYRVPAREIECRLLAEQDKRRRRAANG